MIHWSGHSDSEHESTGRHIEPTPPPPGYDMQMKVEYSLRNIIMMFVTDDSAWAVRKRGAPGLVANGAEEWMKEVVTLVEIQWGRCSYSYSYSSSAVTKLLKVSIDKRPKNLFDLTIISTGSPHSF